MTFLTIFEDGEAKQVAKLTQDDLQSVSDGYLDVFQFRDTHFQRMDRETLQWKDVTE